MIVGLIELVTAHRVEGWAYDRADPTKPLTLRVSDRGTLLAGGVTRPVERPAGDTLSKDKPVQSFCIEFQKQLDQWQIHRVVIEAKAPGDADWHVVPRHVGVMNEAAQTATPDARVIASRELVPLRPWMKAFWSAEPLSTPIASEDMRPVFVLGSARSGTTALVVALAKGTRYRGFREGHVFDVAVRLANSISTHIEKKDQWLPPAVTVGYHYGQFPYAKLHAEVLALLRRLGSNYTSPFWFDKTPTFEMVASVPILAEVWPNARFIFMKRRGLENLSSRLRKFPKTNFVGSSRDWALIMSTWRKVRDAVADKSIELDQRFVLLDPDDAAARVGALLALPPEETEGLAAALRSERPEVTDPSGRAISDMSELGWTAEQIE